MPITKEKRPVFVPKPEYERMYSTLDRELENLRSDQLMPWERKEAEEQVSLLRAQIALLGSSAGEFFYQ